MRVNKTNFHMKGFALGLALKQRRNVNRKSPTAYRARLIRVKSAKSPTFLVPALSESRVT